jgi:V-type H+-transporting ATPase subunit a
LTQVYKKFLKINKNTYSALNKLRVEAGHYQSGLFWIPKKYAQETQDALKEYPQLKYHLKEITNHKMIPPTFFEINEFVWPFHEVVVTYGTPNYKEINPTVFNMITFPFLFGIMFGDIGHGTLLLLFAVYLCWKSDDIKYSNSSLKPFLSSRYMLLLMGFYASYSGLIYNDFMSLPLNLFGTCYINSEGPDGKTVALLAKDCVYPFGFDPKWYSGHNELAFFNSFKMKLAVIIGVLQMSLGVFMKGLNALYNKSALDFFFEFVPQILFLLALFGTMDALIISKWLTDWKGRESEAPSIIA